MATHLTTIKVGNNKYHLSASGKDVYHSKSNKTGGSLLRGVKFINNQILLNSTGRPASEFDLAQAVTKSQSSGCFISTAAYSWLGTSDDGKELVALRRWRDDVLLNDPDWLHLVAEYYEVAPSIAACLSASPHRIQISKFIVEDYVEPILMKITDGKHDEAVNLYQSMIEFVNKVLK